MGTLEVINRIIYHTIESNLVYPNWTDKREYQVLGKLDAEFVKDFLQREFGVDYITNKYAINIPNGTLWYRHDNSTFILKQV
jgi:hypothetical protein